MEILEIAELIKKNGGRLYLVGGGIRDNLLNRPIYDEDYCVVGLSKENFIKLFPKAITRGKTFEVFDLEGKEFALARTEIKTGQGHKNFQIITGKNITIEEDLKRRDLTINSIAQDVLTNEIIDPFNGIKDIKDKVIRSTSNAFMEDPLRVYRTARFASQLEFKVEENTIDMMKVLKPELNLLSKERVFYEFRKALETEKPSIFFETLKQSELLDVHFKEIYDLIGAIQPIKHHPEGDSYNHTLLALDNSSKLTKDTRVRYACLVHDLGKGLTPKEIYPHHYNHDIKGVEPVRSLSDRIGVPKMWKKAGIISSREHMRGGMFFNMTPSKQVNFIEKIDKSVLGLEGMQIVVYSDRNRDLENDILINPKYNFTQIGQEMLKKVNGEYIKNKYNLHQGIEFKNKLHDERVIWIRSRLSK